MTTKLLWAPWRDKFIRRGLKKGCIFCKAKEYVVFKTKHSVCMLNIFPYNNGHLMLAPLRHKGGLSQLTDDEALDLFKALKKAESLLRNTLKPHGFNIGMNISRAAGAGIRGHLHLHIVPRWVGDVNFMSTCSATKVIPQSLKALHQELLRAQRKTG
jgi:ATP adenylyltransferase